MVARVGAIAALSLAALAAAPAVAAATPDTLGPGGTLAPGQALVSADGHYQLIMQTDGNLVVYIAGGRYLWDSGTYGDNGAHATLQTNGNLVLYAPDGEALWSTNTSGAGCSHLVMQNDGNLVIYGGDGKAVWASNTVNQVLEPGDKLTPGQSLYSDNERYQLAMQTDGNFVLYDRSTSKAIWNSVTFGNPGAWAVMQSDGNLVVYSGSGPALWNSGTYGHPGGHLIVQDDGNLVIYVGSTPVWNTGTEGMTTRRATTRRATMRRAAIGHVITPPGNCGVPVTPATTTPSAPPVVVYVPVKIYLPVPRARRHVKVKLTLSWTWNRGHTHLFEATAGRLPRRATITVICEGRGCPGRAETASLHVRRVLKSLAGTTYRAGDRIFITIRAPGRLAERAELFIRYGRKPRVKAL